ncbi:conserved hypothetical protein [Vibrio phage 150E35-1]|nr:conserved hypothetical protein [Vibrio phage 150E35-1]
MRTTHDRPVRDVLQRIYSGYGSKSISGSEYNKIYDLLVEYESDNAEKIASDYKEHCSHYHQNLGYLVRPWEPQGNCIYVDYRPKSKTFIKELVRNHVGMSELFRWMRRNKQMTYSEVIDFFHMMD